MPSERKHIVASVELTIEVPQGHRSDRKAAELAEKLERDLHRRLRGLDEAQIKVEVRDVVDVERL